MGRQKGKAKASGSGSPLKRAGSSVAPGIVLADSLVVRHDISSSDHDLPDSVFYAVASPHEGDYAPLTFTETEMGALAPVSKGDGYLDVDAEEDQPAYAMASMESTYVGNLAFCIPKSDEEHYSDSGAHDSDGPADRSHSSEEGIGDDGQPRYDVNTTMPSSDYYAVLPASVQRPIFDADLYTLGDGNDGEDAIYTLGATIEGDIYGQAVYDMGNNNHAEVYTEAHFYADLEETKYSNPALYAEVGDEATYEAFCLYQQQQGNAIYAEVQTPIQMMEMYLAAVAQNPAYQSRREWQIPSANLLTAEGFYAALGAIKNSENIYADVAEYVTYESFLAYRDSVRNRTGGDDLYQTLDFSAEKESEKAQEDLRRYLQMIKQNPSYRSPHNLGLVGVAEDFSTEAGFNAVIAAIKQSKTAYVAYAQVLDHANFSGFCAFRAKLEKSPNAAANIFLRSPRGVLVLYLNHLKGNVLDLSTEQGFHAAIRLAEKQRKISEEVARISGWLDFLEFKGNLSAAVANNPAQVLFLYITEISQREAHFYEKMEQAKQAGLISELAKTAATYVDFCQFKGRLAQDGIARRADKIWDLYIQEINRREFFHTSVAELKAAKTISEQTAEAANYDDFCEFDRELAKQQGGDQKKQEDVLALYLAGLAPSAWSNKKKALVIAGIVTLIVAGAVVGAMLAAGTSAAAATTTLTSVANSSVFNSTATSALTSALTSTATTTVATTAATTSTSSSIAATLATTTTAATSTATTLASTASTVTSAATTLATSTATTLASTASTVASTLATTAVATTSTVTSAATTLATSIATTLASTASTLASTTAAATSSTLTSAATTLAASTATTLGTTTSALASTLASTSLATTTAATTTAITTALTTAATTLATSLATTTSTMMAQLSVAAATGFQNASIPISIVTAGALTVIANNASQWLGTFSAGAYDAAAHTWTFTAAQLSGLSFIPNLPNNLNAVQAINWAIGTYQAGFGHFANAVSSAITVLGVPMQALSMTISPFAVPLNQVFFSTFSATFPSNALGQVNYFTFLRVNLPTNTIISPFGSYSYDGTTWIINGNNATISIKFGAPGHFNIPISAVGSANGLTAVLTQNWAVVVGGVRRRVVDMVQAGTESVASLLP